MRAELGEYDAQFEPQNEIWSVEPMFNLERSHVYEEIPIPQTRRIDISVDTSTAPNIEASAAFSASSFSARVTNNAESDHFDPRDIRIIEQVSPNSTRLVQHVCCLSTAKRIST